MLEKSQTMKCRRWTMYDWAFIILIVSRKCKTYSQCLGCLHHQPNLGKHLNGCGRGAQYFSKKSTRSSLKVLTMIHYASFLLFYLTTHGNRTSPHNQDGSRSNSVLNLPTTILIRVGLLHKQFTFQIQCTECDK